MRLRQQLKPHGRPSQNLLSLLRPYLDDEVLRSSRIHQVCITCQLHESLIFQGNHLTHCCPHGTEDLKAQIGWVPEAA